MSDRFERFAAKLLEQAEDLRKDNIKPEVWTTLICVAHAAKETEDQPKPGAVPELPEWLRHEEGDEWCITDAEGYDSYYRLPKHPDDLDRIAEACRVLAARERARRAQS